MNDYLNLKNKHQEEFNNFPMFFAFNNKQFEEGMKDMGLRPKETNKIYKTAGGGFYKRTDSKRLRTLLDRHTLEMENAVKGDITGEGFIFDMFDYELGNHEYCYTGDETDTLEALGFSIDDIHKSEQLSNGLRDAKVSQYSQDY